MAQVINFDYGLRDIGRLTDATLESMFGRNHSFFEFIDEAGNRRAIFMEAGALRDTNKYPMTSGINFPITKMLLDCGRIQLPFVVVGQVILLSVEESKELLDVPPPSANGNNLV